MKYTVVIDTKDIPYNMGSGEGSPEVIFNHDNWFKVTIQAVDEDCAQAGHVGLCRELDCSCPCHGGYRGR